MTSTDAVGNESITTSDIVGRTVKQEENKPGGLVTTLAENVYDYAGNVRESKDAKQQSTFYGYNFLGQLTSVTNAKQETTHYSYNMLGQQIRTTFPDQTFIVKKYDGLGRLIKRQDGNSKKATYAYDTNNNMVSQRIGTTRHLHSSTTTGIPRRRRSPPTRRFRTRMTWQASVLR
ncbi:hypothetical protein ACFPVX_09195 [Cohnella faecalis]